MARKVILVLGLMLGLAGGASAQSALAKAEQDLRLAQQELAKLRSGIIEEESTIVGEVEKLDEEVVGLSRSLAKRLEEEASLAGGQKRLDDEIAARKGEFEFTISSLRSYSRGLVNRLSGAEIQKNEPAIEALELKAQMAGEDLPGEVSARLSSIGLGAQRLQEVSGGARFEGRAVGPSNTVLKGRFVLAGPLGYFAASDGSVAGFTSASSGESKIPGLVALKPEEGAPEVAQLVETGSATVPVDASMGKAVQVARSAKTLGEYLEGGGMVGYGIVLLGLTAVLIALFKYVEIQFFPVPGRNQINAILDDLLEGRVAEAEKKAGALKGLGGDLVRAGVEFFFDKRRILEDALMEKLSVIQPRMDRFLPFLAVAAAAGPMMGLLGTVLGIMKTFEVMSAVGTGDSRYFSEGISEALITTAQGLIVAIPMIVVHGMLKSLARSKFGQAEGVALSLLNGTTEIEARDKSVRKEGGDGGEDLDEKELVHA